MKYRLYAYAVITSFVLNLPLFAAEELETKDAVIQTAPEVVPVTSEKTPPTVQEPAVDVPTETAQESTENALPEKTPLPVQEPAVDVPTETAQESADNALPEKTPSPVKDPVPSAVSETLKSLLNQDFQKASIAPAPIKGLYEVVVGSEVLYVTADGAHLILGNIVDAKTRENLTDNKRDTLRAKAIDSVSEKEMIVFAPEKDTKYTVNVFTDVDCGYCAKFHQEVAALNKAGVKIRYLAFPRAGIDSDTYKRMVSVWCSEDQQQAITDAKARRDVPAKECDSPVRKEYELGKSIGVSGTPALVLSDGELVPGYVPAAKLISYLQQKKF